MSTDTIPTCVISLRHATPSGFSSNCTPMHGMHMTACPWHIAAQKNSSSCAVRHAGVCKHYQLNMQPSLPSACSCPCSHCSPCSCCSPSSLSVCLGCGHAPGTANSGADSLTMPDSSSHITQDKLSMLESSNANSTTNTMRGTPDQHTHPPTVRVREEGWLWTSWMPL
jgi:hypothetical protein